ncbi:histidine phosphotransferase [Panus rudis PR-1116 ss-1]|nr:histidine phosphotransferase [Panus rudis PR-1116 ss-1]
MVSSSFYLTFPPSRSIFLRQFGFLLTDILLEQPGSPDTIDLDTFNQIVELDEDDTHDFSHGMVTAYFSQARATFKEMEQALQERNLEKLSSLGHFLKGSSAALGVTKVQASCERMQHYGKRWDEENNVSLTDENAFKKIEPLLARVKGEYGHAEVWLKNWYKERGVEAED